MVENKEVINPFKQNKKTNWAMKSQNKFRESHKTEDVKKNIVKEKEVLKTREVKLKRVSKSFKIYPGDISKKFDKRVNKLQVEFDELDFDKNYIDSGKYLMFLMAFAEEYGIYKLYSNVDKEGKFKIDKDKIKELVKKLK